jgi:hypothetical protein
VGKVFSQSLENLSHPLMLQKLGDGAGGIETKGVFEQSAARVFPETAHISSSYQPYTSQPMALLLSCSPNF